MPNPTITALPTAPSRSMQPSVFVTTADAFLAALPTFVTEANTLGAAVEADAVQVAADKATVAADKAIVAADKATVAADKNAAATSAANAATSESNAATSATNAANYAAALTGTSTTSLVIGTGSKVFTTQAGKQWTVGQWVFAVNSVTNYMFGQITAYAGTSLTVDVQAVGGSGTLGSWTISLAGLRGATGPAGTLSGNAVGDISMVDYQLSRALIIDSGYVFVDKGNSGTTLQTLDYATGHHQKITATGNHTIATSNWPPTGNLGQLLLELTNGGAYTLTWPTINWLKPDGTTTTSIATYLAANTGRATLQSSGTDFILLWTRDGGTTLYGKLV